MKLCLLTINIQKTEMSSKKFIGPEPSVSNTVHEHNLNLFKYIYHTRKKHFVKYKIIVFIVFSSSGTIISFTHRYKNNGYNNNGYATLKMRSNGITLLQIIFYYDSSNQFFFCRHNIVYIKPLIQSIARY